MKTFSEFLSEEEKKPKKDKKKTEKKLTLAQRVEKLEGKGKAKKKEKKKPKPLIPKPFDPDD